MYDFDKLKTIFTAEQIEQRISEIAKQINEDYKDKQEDGICVVGILNGAAIFFADLVRKLELDLRIDFIAASSYKKGTVRSNTLEVIKDVSMDIKGMHILLVEDMIDTGKTLEQLTKMLYDKGVASVKICAFLNKNIYTTDIDVAYSCFDCPNEFVFGYGLDIDQKYRNLPDVCAYKTQETE